MAKERLSSAAYVDLGYGQVEPNHLSAQANKQIYAQLPLDTESVKVLENGMFAKYDYANGKVNMTGEGEWMLVYNTVKIYDERETECDYAMKAPVAGGIVATVHTDVVPRLFKTSVGDIFTTNCVKAESLKVGDVLTPGADGYLAIGEGDMKWQVVKVYTMPDGQKGVKLMRIA